MCGVMPANKQEINERFKRIPGIFYILVAGNFPVIDKKKLCRTKTSNFFL
jgi:hypothetical protein